MAGSLWKSQVSQEGRAVSGASAVPGHQEQTTTAPPTPQKTMVSPFHWPSLHPSLKGSETKEQETRTSSKRVRRPASSPARWHPAPTPYPARPGSRQALSWI